MPGFHYNFKDAKTIGKRHCIWKAKFNNIQQLKECKACETVWLACPRDIKSGTGCPDYSCVQKKKMETRQRNRKEVQ